MYLFIIIDIFWSSAAPWYLRYFFAWYMYARRLHHVVFNYLDRYVGVPPLLFCIMCALNSLRIFLIIMDIEIDIINLLITLLSVLLLHFFIVSAIRWTRITKEPLLLPKLPLMSLIMLVLGRGRDPNLDQYVYNDEY